MFFLPFAFNLIEYEKEDDLPVGQRSSSFKYGQDGSNVSCPTPILDDRLSSLL